MMNSDMYKNKIELLAPAGSMETLKAVIGAGADAVYVGGSAFGARAYAKNFDQTELLSAIDYVHLHNKKLHLTVNTLLKNRELEEQLYDYLLPYYEQGLDAVIVQDPAVFAFMKEAFPGMELHASTQMTIHGPYGAKYWKNAGADRIVLSRELSLEEIRAVHEAVDVDLECFVHGALCYCYSGQCLFSSMLGGRSGNRGRCAQPCRLPYEVIDREVMKHQRTLTEGDCYPLSPKDLCGIDHLPALQAVGVSSLKIEGRMKQTGYAAGVTAIYRKYLDQLEAEGAEHFCVSDKDRHILLDLGNRSGFTDGYLCGEKGKMMISLDSPRHTSTENAGIPSIIDKKRKISGKCVLRIGEIPELMVTDQISGRTITVNAGELQAAQKAAATKADVDKVLRQTGDTLFEFDQLIIELDDNCFVPKQFLKGMRRDAIAGLEETLLYAQKRAGQAKKKEEMHAIQVSEGDPATCWNDERLEKLSVLCDTVEQVKVCLDKFYIADIILQLHGIEPAQYVQILEPLSKLAHDRGKAFYLCLPTILRGETVGHLESRWNTICEWLHSGILAGFVAKSYDAIGFLLCKGIAPGVIHLDASVYQFSDRAVAYFKAQGFEKWTLPLELNVKEMKHHMTEGATLILYGHAPYMVSNQCINKTIQGCDRAQKTLYLKDRYGKQLPVKNYCSTCYNMIYNAVPMMLFDQSSLESVKKIAPERLRLDFTVEHGDVVQQVLASYEKQVLHLTEEHSCYAGETTKGHFKRGVE